MIANNIADWLTREISAGGRIVLLEAFATQTVVVAIRAGRLMVILQPEAGSEGSIIGVGVELASQSGIDAAIPVQDPSGSTSVNTLGHHVIEVGTYQGAVNLSLCSSEHGTRKFTFHV